jgi:anthranilate synthase component 2
MTTRVLVVDHYDSYTWNLVHLIAGVTGELPDVVEHDQPDALGRARDASHVVLSPGPGHPAGRKDFALGSEIFRIRRPVLGVCLGMQALAVGFGGKVEKVEPAHGDVAAITHGSTGVLAGLPQGFAAVRYHSLAVTDVPETLQVTATSAGVVMGLQHVDLPLHGVQFHPESILSECGIQLIANFLGLA